MLRTMYRWCVAAFISGLWNIPIPIDQVLTSHKVQMHVKTDALCKQQWPPKQHPGKKSRHMLHLLCHQGPLGTVCLQQDSNRMCLWLGYPLTPRHFQARLLWSHERVDWRVEWRSVIFNESRFCLYASDVRTCLWHRPDKHHLLVCIRPRHTGPSSGFMVSGLSVTTHDKIWYFCRVK